jgi:hypothetical protein
MICLCGCEKKTSGNVNKFIRGHRKDFEKKMSEKKYYNHRCNCGCEGKIEFKRAHLDDGIPKYIHGHNKITYDDQWKEACRNGHMKNDPDYGTNMVTYHMKARELFGKDHCEICGISNLEHIQKHKQNHRLSMHCYNRNYSDLISENWVAVCEFGCHQSLDDYSKRHKNTNSIK